MILVRTAGVAGRAARLPAPPAGQAGHRVTAAA